mmetsp:Transcript_43868/g.42401  ORF Transcript_43868/g.42401 Transcript_43868/m.42401 type:complete len:90 (-) Transcript_43868:469-738(-)
MHTDVNVLDVLLVREVLLKVFHIGEEESAVAFEVFVEFLALIADMDDNVLVGVAIDTHVVALFEPTGLRPNVFIIFLVFSEELGRVDLL